MKKLKIYSNEKIIMNLQFFGSEGSGGEKTEKPTQKKRDDATKEGQVVKSNEVTTACMLVTMFFGLKIFGENIVNKLMDMFRYSFKLFESTDDFISIVYSANFIASIFGNILIIMIPIFAISFGVGLISNFVQVGWHPTLKPIKPKFSKLSPIKGIKRMFSLKSLNELIKSLLKIILILVIIYNCIKDEQQTLLLLFNMTIVQSAGYVWGLAIKIGIKVGMFYIVIAGLDYGFQKYEHEKNLKMTKQEIKEEYKMQEGNQEVKSKIKQKMREATMRRMMQDVPSADVIITNPTHFAVAVKYDANMSAAPIVVAKGTDFLAAKMKLIAADNKIQIVENKPLARTIYYTVDIGDDIPPDLYQAVAEVLAFVYNLKQ